MARVDRIGTYRGVIEDSSIQFTRNKFPQFAGAIKVTERWVDDAEEMKHFELEEPAWVDWSEYGETAFAYLVLFKDADNFTEETALLNYEQLQLALGWDGTEFGSLADGTHKGKTVLFRVEENEYQGKVSLQVNWIDAPDASPTRELRRIDDTAVKALNAKLKVKKAKPAVAKPKASAPKAKATPKASAPKAAPPKAAPPTPEPEPATADDGEEVTKIKAWEFVCENTPDTPDTEVQDAWIAACSTVADGRDEDTFTSEDWAKVRQTVCDSLGVTV